jgi:hypothetical protein
MLNRALISALLMLFMALPCYGAIHIDDASNDYVSSNNNTLGATLATFSFSVWVKGTAPAGVNDVVIMGSFDDGTSMGLSVEIDQDGATGYFNIYIRDDSGGEAYQATVQTDQEGAGGLIDGSWHHLYASVDVASDDVQIWIDGSSQTVAETIDTNPSNYANFQYDWDIGAINFRGTHTAQWEGELSDLCIWSDEQDGLASIIYNSKVKGICQQLSPSTLIHYYPLDDVSDGQVCSSDTMLDRTGTSNATCVTGDGAAEEVLSYP